MNAISIVSYNARGLGNVRKRRELFNLFHSKHFKIILVQETHSTKASEAMWKAEWGGKIYFSHGTTNQRGVAVMIKKGVDVIVEEVLCDNEGRWVLLKASWNSEKVVLGCIYAPNMDEPNFFINFLNKVEGVGVDRKIIGGDFNLILDHGIDREGRGQHKNVKASKIVNKMIDELDYVDPWRELYPNKPGFTWKRLNPYNLQERLDLFLINEEFTQFLQRMVILPSYKSDHAMVVMYVSFGVAKRGPGYWKLNTELLKDKDFIESINKLLEIELAQIYPSKKDQWEIIKLGIRTTALQYSSRKQRDRVNRLQVLLRKLHYHEMHQDEYGIFEQAEAHMNALRKEIEVIQAFKTQGAILRSKSAIL